jgi:putative selenate reductase
MSDRFQPISMDQLCGWIFRELESHQSIFGVPRSLFFVPQPGDRFTQRLYGSRLDTPFGVAAGPHTQMAQNIIVAWLCGSRFIELKTVQTLDELNVAKPCIDMQDVGYNVEWSQELKIDQSFEEYLRAWVLLHALHHKLGFAGEGPGVIFNLSVGYNYEGVLQPNVQSFLKRTQDAGPALARCVDEVAKFMPEVKQLNIPARMSNNVTLSTMHGCPPGEIGKIARYLIEEWGLHTSVKLNPTLLGPEGVRGILNDRLGYRDVTVPDLAFEHDLKYPDALNLLRELRAAADAKGVVFGVKLSNTLEVVNRRDVFSKAEKMMYLSGRPLHAITVNLAHKLMEEFDGDLLVSFAGGADAFNAARLLACGMTTITTCSDLLRPGSYSRLGQYIEKTAQAMAEVRAEDLLDFTCKTAARESAFAAASCGMRPARVRRLCARLNLQKYAEVVLDEPLLQRDRFERNHTKTARTLGLFDCIKAPCREVCAVEQKVPLYMQAVREGRMSEAVEIVRDDNPLGAILGRACNHPCQHTCVRTHYDEPLAIREIKRFIMDHEAKHPPAPAVTTKKARVAVIGAGPCGLGAAYFLAVAGYPVTLLEGRAYPGGMVAGSIPGYRATAAVIGQDLDRILALGVELKCNQKAGRDFTLSDLRRQGYRYIVVAAGAQLGQRLGIPGEDTPGVMDALDFLRAAREKKLSPIGRRVGVVGGGDVAMDCARTAWRLGADEVSVIYRRTREQMPAQYEERHGLEEEGIPVRELLAPKEVRSEDGRLSALRCAKMQLGEPDASGRRRPVEIPGAEEEVPLDTLVVAISQRGDFGLFDGDQPKVNKHGYLDVDPGTLATSLEGVFAGGDAVQDGPATIVKAVGDGKRIAKAIRNLEEGATPVRSGGSEADLTALLRKRARREFRVAVPERGPGDRRNFEEIVQTLSPEAARKEAERCIDCNLLCSQCVAVCPNLAFLTYRQKPLELALPDLVVKQGALVAGRTTPYRVEQRFQVCVLTDFCNECGNCVTFCPTSGRPWHDKPRLYLDRAEFEAQSDNAFRLFRDGSTWLMQARWAGQTHEIALNHDLRYHAPGVKLELDAKTFAVRKASASLSDGTSVSLVACAAMVALLRGLRDSTAYVPVAELNDLSEIL